MNLQDVKRKLEVKIQENTKLEAMKTVLLKKLNDEYGVKTLKEGQKKLKTIVEDREALEEEYQTRMDALQEKVKEYNLFKE